MPAVAGRPTPTIKDLRVKLCYICREEELYNEPESPPRRWVHPCKCKCSLIAHESCLLEWIRSSESTSRAANSIKCPQCGTKYELKSNRPFVLRLLTAGHRALSLAGVLFVAGTISGVLIAIGGGIYAGLTSYGAFALEQLIGRELYDIILADDPSLWPWHAFLNLPLIPISLMFSASPITQSLLPLAPMLLVWTVTSPRPDPFARIILNNPANTLASLQALDWGIFTWPPSPALLGLFGAPMISAVYRVGFTRFSHWVLGTTPSTAIQQRQQQEQQGGNRFFAINLPFGFQIGANVIARDGRAPERGNAGIAEQNGNVGGGEGGEEGEVFRVELNIEVEDDDHDDNWEDEDEEDEDDHHVPGHLPDLVPVDGQARPPANQPPPPPVANNPPAANNNAPPPPPPPANADAPAAGLQQAAQRIIGFESACTGLLLPILANTSGALLYKLSAYSPLLRAFLAIRPLIPTPTNRPVPTPTTNAPVTMASSILTRVDSFFVADAQLNQQHRNWQNAMDATAVPRGVTQDIGILHQIALGFKLSFRAILGGSAVWRAVDPVWWRNTVGLGTLVVLRDTIRLLYLYLRRRELKSRKLVDRDFEGVNPRELDLIVPW